MYFVVLRIRLSQGFYVLRMASRTCMSASCPTQHTANQPVRRYQGDSREEQAHLPVYDSFIGSKRNLGVGCRVTVVAMRINASPRRR